MKMRFMFKNLVTIEYYPFLVTFYNEGNHVLISELILKHDS